MCNNLVVDRLPSRRVVVRFEFPLLGAVYGNQDAMDAFVSVTAGTVSPIEFFDPDHVGAIFGAAAEREPIAAT